MNKPIFDRCEFALCEVPVPKGCPQSQTHSGIAMRGGKFYLTTSPYPERRDGRWRTYARVALRKLSMGLLCKLGELYENPCLYVGAIENSSDIPVRFQPLQPFPLINTPKSLNGLLAYNSDPDIHIEGDRVYILNRSIFQTTKLPEYQGCDTKIYLITGNLNNNGQYNPDRIDLIKEWNMPYASPCFTKYKGKFIFTYLDTNSAIDAETFGGLYLQRLASIEELKSQQQYIKVNVKSNGLLPWHMSLFQYEGTLYSIVACVKKGDISRKVWQMLGQFSDDLTELKIFSTPLTDYNSYRGSACVREDGLFILYSTTVCENIKGSKAVDGRNVIVAAKKFSLILETVRN